MYNIYFRSLEVALIFWYIAKGRSEKGGKGWKNAASKHGSTSFYNIWRLSIIYMRGATHAKNALPQQTKQLTAPKKVSRGKAEKG